MTMGVYLLLAVSGLALTESFLHAGGADHGPALNDRLDKLERASSHHERRFQQLEADKRRWEEDKRMWEKDKRQWEEDKRQWHEDKRQMQKNLLDLADSKRQWTSEQKRDLKIATRHDSSFSHEVMSRATGASEPEVAQMSQRLGELTADLQATKTDMTAEIQATKNEIQFMKEVNTQQDQAIQKSRASVFVRWGRSVCPDSSSLVYSGAVGGSWYLHTGAASNYLCLSLSPVFSSHAIPHVSAYLYGGEYQTFDANFNHNPPCAVCRSARPTTMMVPGTNQCPFGWTLEYGGHLMAGYSDYPAASEYICVDVNMENRPSGHANEDGKLMYFVITRCGSLPCPPYADNKVVTCAICSK